MGKRQRKRLHPAGVSRVEEPVSGPHPDADAPPVRQPSVLRRWLLAGGVLVVLVVGVVLLLSWELRASPLQARYFSSIAGDFSFEVAPGPADSIHFPGPGPYDTRFGYHELPRIITELESRGFVVEAQARQSPALRQWMERGYFPVYHEKSGAGLDLADAEGMPLHHFRSPLRAYSDFESIPPLVWRTLLFVENRTLLDARYPTRNPALEWRRLGRAVFELGLKTLGSERTVPGASTLATQIEKFRHSPAGRTESPRDKLVQMMSASARAYMDGPVTLQARQRIVRDYLNSIPYAGIAGIGEVSGLGDALEAWFGADFDEVNELLFDLDAPDLDEATMRRAALAYRQVAMLILAVQRPSYFLVAPGGREALEARTRRYLDLLTETEVLTPRFRDEVLAAEVTVRKSAPARIPVSFVERKAPDAVRTQLLPLTGVSSLYAVDRLDVSGTTTFHKEAQDSIAALLMNLRDPDFVARQGLRAFRLLDRGDPAGVHYSFVLQERTSEGNAVRVRADTYDGPFRLTGGGKLELGSTAKLRTLVSYLEAIEELHRELSVVAADSLRRRGVGANDRLTAWALGWLVARPDATLAEMLDAALERSYSANPGERFFTGGGVHTFVNFDRVHDARSVSVREAFQHSVNLPFIRIMRDVVYYRIHRLPGYPANVLSDRDDPRRREYLARFADQEGRIFLGQFHRKHEGKNVWESLGLLAEGRTLTPTRLAWAFRSVLPDEDVEAYQTFLHDRSDLVEVSRARTEELFRRADPAGVPLVDQGYLAGVHPLELWAVRYLSMHPGATRADLVGASRDVRQEVYGWLFSTRRTAAQDQRIRSILEAEAFQEIHRSWRRLGYPFESLVPSYATSIGSSADRPDALAELVGILVADGVRHPPRMLTELRFAVDTPFETHLRRSPVPGERVLSTEVARAVRSTMVDVVESGTAVRARGAVRDGEGTPMVIGGKTGTGNNRHRVFGAGGRILEDRALNRTSTLVFFLGDRFYGSITAFVDGPAADDYGFTSSLPAQILRMAGPLLAPLIGAETQ